LFCFVFFCWTKPLNGFCIAAPSLALNNRVSPM
jgi:hypothetical protein